MQYLDRIIQFHTEVNLDKEKFIRKIRGFGFKNKTPERNNIYVYIKPDIDFVIKIEKNPEGLDDIPDAKHPLHNHFLHPVYEKNGVRIQARVRLYNLKKAYNEIQYSICMDDNALAYYDVGPWNVGWRKGKPVIFDCLP